MTTIGSTAISSAAAAQPTEAERAAAAELLPMIWGIHISRALYAVAELGIADLLTNGPASTEELSRATGTHEPSLYRVLRFLAALRVLDEHETRRFSLTLLGERLRSQAPAGMRSWAMLLETVGGARPFEHILDTVKTGKPGLDIAFGTDWFGFLAQHPRNAAVFDAAMAERTAAFAPSIAEPIASPTSAPSSTSAAETEPCWSRSCESTRTCMARCSRSPPWPPAPKQYSTQPMSATAATC